MPERAEMETVSVRRAADGVDIFTVRSSSRLWRAVNDCYIITVARTGLGSWGYRQRQWQTGEGWLMLMEPGEVHVTLEVRHPADFDVVRVEPGVMQELFLDVLGTENVHFNRGDVWHPALHRAWRLWLAEVQAGLAHELAAAELRGLLRQLIELVAEQGRHRRLVQVAAEVVKAQQLLRDVGNYRTVADVAAVVQKHPDYLSHRFRRAYGISPKQFQALVRVSAAKRLLLRGPTAELRDLAAVSQAVGYYDQSHMAREFKALLGARPSILAQVAGW